MFFGVQDPNQGQGSSGLVAPGNSLFCCNRVKFSSKNHGFVATGYHFLRKQWFCCNRVPLSSKNNGFVATGCNFPRKTMVLLQQGAIFHPKQWIFHLKPSISWRRDREVFGLPCYQTDEEKSWKNAQKCAPPPQKKTKKTKNHENSMVVGARFIFCNGLRITFLKTCIIFRVLGLLVGGSRNSDFFWLFFFLKFFFVTDWVLSF